MFGLSLQSTLPWDIPNGLGRLAPWTSFGPLGAVRAPHVMNMRVECQTYRSAVVRLDVVGISKRAARVADGGTLVCTSATPVYRRVPEGVRRTLKHADHCRRSSS